MSIPVFQFADGSYAFISDKNTVVYFDATRRKEFSGFPNEKAAREFIFFGNFSPLKENEFLKTTGYDYHLTYKETVE